VARTGLHRVLTAVSRVGLAALSGAVAAGAASAEKPDLLARALALGCNQIVFAERAAGKDGHWYANFGYAATGSHYLYGGQGGFLHRLDLRTRERTVLLADPDGDVRDPQVHYDGNTILFSYRPGGTHVYHLWEIHADGTGLRQLTRGPYDDIEPTYTPGGDIIFVSARCRCWVPCWFTPVAALFRCGPGGEAIRPISANMEQENTPQMLPDGRVLYTRWEYVDRNNVAFHHLWTINPDGTGAMTYFGNMHPGNLYIDARPIPGTRKVVMIDSPGHGRREHTGAVAVVDPDAGPDARHAIRHVAGSARGGGRFRDPYPLTHDLFLVACDKDILLMDADGATQVVCSAAGVSGEGREPTDRLLHEPQPLMGRPRECLVPDRVDLEQSTGRFLLTDVARGRNMAALGPGRITKLLILEPLPKPVNFNGWMGQISYKRSYFLERILGTVPVETDGSAHFEVPAGRPVLFVALDAGDRAVKRMRSFAAVMPGEDVGCVGCHEQRTETNPAAGPLPLAHRRPPSKIAPIAGVPDVLDFPRDIQPILDRHCVRCHNYEKGPPPADLPMVGARGPWFSHSYHALTRGGYAGVETHRYDGNDAPYTGGSYAAPLMRHLGRLSEREQMLIRLWIDCNAPYTGTYAAMGTGFVPLLVSRDVLVRRCGPCHPRAEGDRPSRQVSPPPVRFKESYGDLFSYLNFATTRDDWDEQRRQLPFLGDHGAGGERFYNLTDPERSPILLAPLAKDAGGWGVCRPRTAPQRDPAPQEPSGSGAVFASTSDPAYRQILSDIRTTKAALDEVKRFDMPGFRPSAHYLREMERYGVVPARSGDATGPVDPYALDRAYWQSLWHAPRPN